MPGFWWMASLGFRLQRVLVHLDPGVRGIYNDLAKCIQKCFEEPESKQSKTTGPPQPQAVSKLSPRIMQRTVRAKRAIPLPLPRSRSRDSELQQIETNASATTAQPITIPCSGWESNKVRRCSAQVHPIHGNTGRATAPIRRITTNPIPTRTPISEL